MGKFSIHLHWLSTMVVASTRKAGAPHIGMVEKVLRKNVGRMGGQFMSNVSTLDDNRGENCDFHSLSSGHFYPQQWRRWKYCMSFYSSNCITPSPAFPFKMGLMWFVVLGNGKSSVRKEILGCFEEKPLKHLIISSSRSFFASSTLDTTISKSPNYMYVANSLTFFTHCFYYLTSLTIMKSWILVVFPYFSYMHLTLPNTLQHFWHSTEVFEWHHCFSMIEMG